MSWDASRMPCCRSAALRRAELLGVDQRPAGTAPILRLFRLRTYSTWTGRIRSCISFMSLEVARSVVFLPFSRSNSSLHGQTKLPGQGRPRTFLQYFDQKIQLVEPCPYANGSPLSLYSRR